MFLLLLLDLLRRRVLRELASPRDATKKNDRAGACVIRKREKRHLQLLIALRCSRGLSGEKFCNIVIIFGNFLTFLLFGTFESCVSLLDRAIQLFKELIDQLGNGLIRFNLRRVKRRRIIANLLIIANRLSAI